MTTMALIQSARLMLVEDGDAELIRTVVLVFVREQ
jgi:hypothetical protein